MSNTADTGHTVGVSVEAAELLCPMCDYDLRGQVEPRCPECGYRFDWEELRDPARRLHPYLFEHHPERNVWSWWRTLIGGLRPRQFWGTLAPSQPSRPRRLMIYAVIVALAALVPSVILTVRDGARTWSQMAADRARVTAALARPGRLNQHYRARAPRNATTQQVIDIYTPAPSLQRVLEQMWRQRVWAVTRAHWKLLYWPLATLLALMIFVVSMRRARLRRVHLIRSVVYSGDVIIWANVPLAGLLVWQLLQDLGAGAFSPIVHAKLPPLIAAAAVLVFIYRLVIALRKYLRFDHPISTVLATQIMVLLLWEIIVLNL